MEEKNNLMAQAQRERGTEKEEAPRRKRDILIEAELPPVGLTFFILLTRLACLPHPLSSTVFINQLRCQPSAHQYSTSCPAKPYLPLTYRAQATYTSVQTTLQLHSSSPHHLSRQGQYLFFTVISHLSIFTFLSRELFYPSNINISTFYNKNNRYSWPDFRGPLRVSIRLCHHIFF